VDARLASTAELVRALSEPMLVVDKAF